MTTISVPLSSEQAERLDALVGTDSGANRADVMRRALDAYAEEQAIRAVLEAEREVSLGKILRGNARSILLSK